MFERFTEDARQVVLAAAQEARRHQDSAIGTIALFIGVADVDGFGKDALLACGTSAERLVALRDDDGEQTSADAESAQRGEPRAGQKLPSAVEPKPGGRIPMAWLRRRQVVRSSGDRLPFTAGAKKSLELGLREAIRLDQDAVGAGHLLLGLLRAEDDRVERLLAAAGVAPTALRAETLWLLGAAGSPVEPDPADVGVDHLALQVADPSASKAFYDAALAPLGVSALMEFGGRVGYGPAPAGTGRPQFWIGPMSGVGTPREVHVAFTARDRDAVKAFYEAAVRMGAQVLHEPREFPEYHPGYWASFVRDPDGNNVEAVCHRADGSR